jgi:hypothetical protein
VAVHAVRSVGELAEGLVLAPERYDPRRSIASSSSTRIGDLARIARASWKVAGRPVLVLDTGHASEGAVRLRHPPEGGVGSSKRALQPGDLIVSRLRPYLRQVGWIDPALFARIDGGNDVACSTEFHVLRPRGGSIAFLVPWILGEPVQAALAAAQEGGHHPRVPVDALLALPVPTALLEQRDAISDAVEARIAALRGAADGLEALARRDWGA